MDDLTMKKGILVLPLLVSCAAAIGSGKAPEALVERYSYALGVQLGQALQQQGVRAVDAGMLADAIDDVLGGRPLKMTRPDMQSAVESYNAARARAAAEAGQAFLAQNGQRPEVVTLPNGLQYEVLEPGTGARPAVADTVKVHYRGTRIDGLVFDSSESRGQPAEFPLDGVIPGFREAITRMRVGGRWRVVVPADLAYGARGAGAEIGPNETLIFEISLIDIMR
jgi:FKBP-type peptidyl-prolyl cis-trans isomerase FklB